MLNETWDDQYARMLRVRDMLVKAGTRDWDFGSAQARDALYHFFQDAYHLKDWIKAERPNGVTPADVEALFDSDPTKSEIEMRLCADLCNRTKHAELTKVIRTGDAQTQFASQSVRVHVGAGVAHRWTIGSNDKTYDVAMVVEKIVATWDKWLAAEGLQPSPSS